MKYHDVMLKWLLGGFVVYHEHLASVIMKPLMFGHVRIEMLDGRKLNVELKELTNGDK